jgi:hypothetical protein
LRACRARYSDRRFDQGESSAFVLVCQSSSATAAKYIGRMTTPSEQQSWRKAFQMIGKVVPEGAKTQIIGAQ